MAPHPDTSAIARLVAQARRRLRVQGALEGATTATILAAAAALLVVFAVRIRVIAPGTGIALLVATAGVIVVGTALGAARRLRDEDVARRIDRASGLADRLSTAIAFVATPRDASEDDVTVAMMTAAIRDGVRAVPRANVRAATPFAAPRDLRAAAGFVALSLLAAGLTVPHHDRSPQLLLADPDQAAQGSTVTLRGRELADGPSDADATDDGATGALPDGAAVYLAPPTATTATALAARQVTAAPRAAILGWTARTIRIQLAPDAPLGKALVFAVVDGRLIGPVALEILPRGTVDKAHRDAVAIDDDDLAYARALVAELKNAALREQVPELDAYVAKLQKLLDDAEQGKLTKEQLLDKVAEAEAELQKGAEPNQAEVDKKLAELGKQLAKDPLTKELGQALEKNDLTKAQEQLEKLADKLDKKELTEKQQQELGEQLDKAQQAMAKEEKQEQDKAAKQRQSLEEQERTLEKKKDEAKTPEEKLDAERRLDEKQRELKKLEKDQDSRQASNQRRALERLSRDMEKAAEGLKKPKPGGDKKDGDKKDGDKKDGDQQAKDGQKKPGDQQDDEDGQQQASRNLKDAARETGKVSQDHRKQASQKKVASQMEDLKEAMRRAKQKGKGGGKDPFGKGQGKDGKNQDYLSRSRGQKGSGQAWKPGQGQQGQGQGQQGQGQGQGGDQPGGDGAQQGGEKWGTGHDPNLTGQETGKSGNTKDQDLQGVQGKGSSRRETILAAAQKGFASVGYRDVYADYKKIVEEVMRTEKVPSSYKYYVKRYFTKIKPNAIGDEPSSVDPPAPVTPAPTPTP